MRPRGPSPKERSGGSGTTRSECSLEVRDYETGEVSQTFPFDAVCQDWESFPMFGLGS